MQEERLEVLKFKLQGLSPEKIALKMNIRLATVINHNEAIKRQMQKENSSDLASISPDALESVLDVVGKVLPYMEKTTKKVLKQSRGLKPLHQDMIENMELTHALINKRLHAELLKEEPDMKIIQQLNNIQIDGYVALFNKNGIQVVNLLNDNSNNIVVQQKEERMKKLRNMMGTGVTEPVVEAELADEAELDEKEAL